MARLGLGLIASFLIARALGPAGYGVYAVLAATVGIVAALAEGGLSEAAVLRMSTVPLEAEARGSAFFWLRAALAAFVVALVCLLGQPIAAFVLHVDDGLLRWALLGIVATALSGATSAMLQARGAFGRMSWLTLFNTGLTAVLAAVLALLNQLTLLTALVILGIGTSLATFALGLRLLPNGWALHLPGARELANEAKQLVRTGRWLWIASIFAMLAVNLDVLILNRWADLAVVGAYALALSLASKADLVNQSLYTVLLPRVATLETPAAVRLYARQGLFRSALIAIALLILLPIAEPAIVLIYGAEYRSTAEIFRWLIAVVIFDVLTMPFLLLPLTYQRPRQMAAADALRALTLGLVGLALVPGFGALGAVVARFSGRLAGALLVFSLVWRRLRDPAQRSDPRLAVGGDRPA